MMLRFAAAGLLLLAQTQHPPQQPLIRSGVELVRIDVQVSARNGQPVANLKPEQFEVSIDGRRLPVVALDFVRYADLAVASPPPPLPPEAPLAERLSGEGRTIILAVDQASIMLGSAPAAVEVIRRIADMVGPHDSVGLVAYPGPGTSLAPTRDRGALLGAAKKIDGQLHLPKTGRIVLTLAETIDFGVDNDARQRIFAKYCMPGDNSCRREVEMIAAEVTGTFQLQAMRSLSGLRSVIEAVREYPGRKTLVVVSAGFPASDRMGGKPDMTFEADMLGKRAAEANAVLYSLHMDVGFLYAFSAQGAGQQLQTVFRDSQILARGLEQFTGSGGGTTITVHASPDQALKRLLSETSAYYLLGVEPLPEHRDGKLHRISVRVKQRGAQVRSRNTVLIPKRP